MLGRLLNQIKGQTQGTAPSQATTERHRRFALALYRHLLGREPDGEALQNCIQDLGSGSRDMVDLLEDIAESQEFKARINLLSAINQLEDDSLLSEDVVFVASDVIQRLYEKTACFWRTTASQPSEIYHSVITFEQYKGVLPEDTRTALIETGAPYIDRIKAAYEQLSGRPANEAHALDFGCGVGRLAINAAKQFRAVTGADFSKAHLAEAESNSQRLGAAANTSFIHIDTLDTLTELPKADLVYSLITLQHNTPPVMAHIIERLLSILEPNGLAFLHIPLATVGYRFSPASYLADPLAGTQMEMHILPKNHSNKIAAMHGSEVVSSYCIGETGGTYSEEIVFRKLSVNT